MRKTLNKAFYMATFSKDEVFTATQVVRSFGSILSGIGEKKRAVILKNGHFEAVILSMDEYERMVDAVMLLETIYSRQKEVKSGE